MTAAEPASVADAARSGGARTAVAARARAAAPASEARIRAPLVRPRELVLGGVSVALARHLGMPVALVRALFAVLGALGAIWVLYALWMQGAPVAAMAGLAPTLLYAWLWALAPREPGTQDSPRTRLVPVAAILLGCGVACALIVPFTWGPTYTYVLLPIGLAESALALLTAIAWTVAVDPRDPQRAVTAPVVRGLASGLLIVLGLAPLPASFADARTLVAIVCVALVLLGIAGFVLPPLIDRWASRAAERAALAREEQRAEIAAHLHDSVLQTLAIIQNRAGAGSEIARIARAQERELRDWLFAGTDPFAGDLATELKTIARELELEHAVRIEVVTVGDVGAIESGALAGAAREALVNAARHAGGEVTVYAEATPEAIEVFVRDRGAGFDPDAVPDGRLGIRESIVGRMARAGGTGTVTSGEEGTEVLLRLPRRAAPASGTAPAPNIVPAAPASEGGAS
ncbi:MAG TPA: ATP-binding protein [Protaetiibacter sp.]|jgi:signal transduction histidine kinase|nr:ATP-binding protein [Protaetiibacter sp.]